MQALTQSVETDLARSALIVVDMQNDFCHPQGWFVQKGIDVQPMRAPIPMLQRLLPAWRGADARVIWLNWGLRADRLNLSPLLHYKAKRTADGVGYDERSPIDRGRSLVAGEWGAQVIDKLPVDAADIAVSKHRLSGFWDHELDSALRDLGSTTLLFSGINTDRCVFSSLQDAGFLGYDCVLLQDACGTLSPAYVTEVNRDRASLMDYVRWSAVNPARAWGLSDVIGAIAIGMHADIAFVDMGLRGALPQNRLHSLSKISPWHGRAVQGHPLHTLVRGRFVMQGGKLVTEAAGWGRSVKPVQRMPRARPRNQEHYSSAIRETPSNVQPNALPAEDVAR